MVSLEGLTKIVDPSQLTADFDGSLEYNHDDWIEVLMFSLFYLISALWWSSFNKRLKLFFIIS